MFQTTRVENHVKDATKLWWEYRQGTVLNWKEFKQVFLQYHEGLVTRDSIRREFDISQKKGEPLDQLVWKKRSLYLRLYPDADEEEQIKYIVGTLLPEFRRVHC